MPQQHLILAKQSPTKTSEENLEYHVLRELVSHFSDTQNNIDFSQG